MGLRFVGSRAAVQDSARRRASPQRQGLRVSPIFYVLYKTCQALFSAVDGMVVDCGAVQHRWHAGRGRRVDRRSSGEAAARGCAAGGRKKARSKAGCANRCGAGWRPAISRCRASTGRRRRRTGPVPGRRWSSATPGSRWQRPAAREQESRWSWLGRFRFRRHAPGKATMHAAAQHSGCAAAVPAHAAMTRATAGHRPGRARPVRSVDRSLTAGWQRRWRLGRRAGRWSGRPESGRVGWLPGWSIRWPPDWRRGWRAGR